MDRRRFLSLLGKASLGAAALGLTACRTFLGHVPTKPPPFGVKSFVARCLEGLDPAKLWDAHVHLVGIGKGGTGAWVNDAYRKELYESFLFELYMLAAGVDDIERADALYVERVLRLGRLALPEGKLVLMGFDFVVDEEGNEDRERSELYTPNAYLYEVDARFPDDVAPCSSIHPYRKDALDHLDEAKAKGAVAVRWLPNAQGIDPAKPRLVPFYRKMAEHGLVLITHAGEERAVDSKDAQTFGNPLKLRRALDEGVRVVIAHAAGLGRGENLDAREVERCAMESFDLFLRLMDERDYERTLFADILAMTQFNRCGRPLRELMKRKELHPRLVNGSDYPLPAINPLVSTRFLERKGLLSRDDRKKCNRIYEVNPLLFDLVMKRCLRVEERGEVHRFSDVVFESARIFDGGR